MKSFSSYWPGIKPLDELACSNDFNISIGLLIVKIEILFFTFPLLNDTKESFLV